ncbi:TetR/AcrR family transcriptional regulator [Mycobacterium sp. CBMA271]|uniref:TetR/AcrR family transcriptional regulator n=1 Tax=unclassified Mycobacteroides TaxID=2618759 RepID=UPI00132C143C|nr:MULTISPECIES: TetR family transcriptional regulator [unclassified Mycobacteroides]MUM19485.1 TetR family transcriptional regulator [Mycobacteroides sp. CBMA 326]MUM20356.1 TetR/AcrR family transcriptional regulator [Mycobacteroides sp. CBMA 271]
MSGPRLQPRKQPRQDRAEATRRRILDAAAHVFADFGYAAGTTNRIAERADVSIGSLYQYFPNKDSILVELMTAHTQEGFAHVQRHLTAGLPESIEDMLHIFVRAAIDNHRDNPRLHRVLFEEAPRPPEFLEMLHRSEDIVVAQAEAILAAHPDVRVSETAMAARMVVATIESLTHRLVAGPRPVNPQSFEDELVGMLTRYLTG